jgi:hypothetical protein
MPSPTIRVINWHDRPWINREFQQFCGQYRLDEASGLYFEFETPAAQRALISRTFLRLPDPLRNAALYLNLTVGTTNMSATRSGSLSAVYGAWDASNHSRIVPHLEMTQTSLSSQFVFPHLVHECCHLFWAIQSRSAKAQYAWKMVELLDCGFIEVTGYAQGFFDDWQRQLDNDEPGASHRRRHAMDKWVMESFCESIAKLCCPSYKENENRDTESMLDRRRSAMVEIFELSLEDQLEVA